MTNLAGFLSSLLLSMAAPWRYLADTPCLSRSTKRTRAGAVLALYFPPLKPLKHDASTPFENELDTPVDTSNCGSVPDHLRDSSDFAQLGSTCRTRGDPNNFGADE